MSKAEEQAAHVSAWRASGQTGPVYSAEHGLKVSSLHTWSSRLKRKAAKGVRMARVKKVGGNKVEPPGGMLRLVSVEVPAGLDADALRQVLSLFEAKK